MSRENAEIVRRALDAWNRRDAEAMLELADPEVEYVNAPNAVEPGTRHGHEGLRAVLEAQWEFLGDAEVVIERIQERGGDFTTSLRFSRSMPGSDARVDTLVALMWRVRDGKVVRIEVLGTAADAAAVQESLEGAERTDSA